MLLMPCCPDGVGGKCELSDIDLMGLKLGSVHNGQVRKWVWSQGSSMSTQPTHSVSHMFVLLLDFLRKEFSYHSTHSVNILYYQEKN